MFVKCFIRNCHGLHDPIPTLLDNTYTWATASLCNVCSARGYICLDGCSLRKAFETRHQLKFHNYRKHHDHDTSGDMATVDWMDHQDSLSQLVVPPVVLQSNALQSFLDRSIADGTLAAIRHYVCGACFGTSMLARDVINSVPIHDTYIVLLTARLVFRIGTVHQVLLSSLLAVFVYARPQLGPSSLPITRHQMRRVITNISTSTSIASSMPTPRPRELGTRHAYLPLDEVIGHALGLQPLNSVVLEKYQRLMRSVRGTQCLAASSFALDIPATRHLLKLSCCLTFWFDGWDPNSSLCKANKTPIWSGTVTLIVAELDGAVMYVTTRLIANGPGKADHTEVIQCILDNVVTMQANCRERTFWVRAKGDYALVYPSVLLVTCDQPERRTITGLLAGNSKLHSCYGISCHTGLLLRPLEACASCISGIEAYVNTRDFLQPFSNRCTSCLQWTLPHTNMRDSNYVYTTPIDPLFPVDAIAGMDVNTHASVITTKMLMQAWDEAFSKWIVQNIWTAKHVEAYFKVLTINDASIALFLDQGRRCLLANVFRSNPGSVRDLLVRKRLEESMLNEPGKFVKPKYPPMWVLVHLDQLPEAVMHLAMGVVKAVSKFVHTWAKARNKSPYLAERMNFCINMHRKFCRIGRCPMATYSQLGKFPGWVADTFRTWWIWMPWFYAAIDNPKFQHTPYVLPSAPPCQWNGQICTKFLKSRGVAGYSRLNAEESKAAVLTMSASSHWPMQEVIPSACAVSGLHLQQMIWHCHALFKNLFAEPHHRSHEHAADGHVKLLLSHITRLDRLMHVQEKLPNLYETKYNFISLPRAVRLLRTYGSARNIQEGGTDGEGIVKVLRPLTPRGLKQHFARNLMNAFHRDQQLGELCTEVGSQLTALQEHPSHQHTVIEEMINEVENELDASEDVMESELGKDLEDGTTFMGSLHTRLNNLNLSSDDLEEDPDDVRLFEVDTQQFKKYRSLAQLLEYRNTGLPLSFVVATVEGHSCIGFVVGSGSTWHLVPALIGSVMFQSLYGFTYFHIDISSEMASAVLMYSSTDANNHTQHHSVVNYGHLLPHLPSLDDPTVNGPVPYSVVTTDANHMNASYVFI